ncbi:unnamed protein product, partial [Rangifer tarandus platyrhynchus]
RRCCTAYCDGAGCVYRCVSWTVRQLCRATHLRLTRHNIACKRQSVPIQFDCGPRRGSVRLLRARREAGVERPMRTCVFQLESEEKIKVKAEIGPMCVRPLAEIRTQRSRPLKAALYSLGGLSECRDKGHLVESRRVVSQGTRPRLKGNDCD